MSNMPDEEFKATLQMLVPMIIETICKQYGMDEYSALHSLYASRLYSDLERERTKLWHLSPLALAELWYQDPPKNDSLAKYKFDPDNIFNAFILPGKVENETGIKYIGGAYQAGSC